jgi:hypothetical protein
MTRDKRIVGVIESARRKREEGSGLCVKEWCALAGYGYDQGLATTHKPGFPIFQGLIVWEDWTRWRQIKLQLATGPRSQTSAVQRLEPVHKSGE